MCDGILPLLVFNENPHRLWAVGACVRMFELDAGVHVPPVNGTCVCVFAAPFKPEGA